MFAEAFEAGGPLMYAVLAAWVVVLAGLLDRACYVLGCVVRRPWSRALQFARAGDFKAARQSKAGEQRRAHRGLTRIESVSQLATSIGLFGTVVGIARSFFARGAGSGLAAPEALASGLSTALYTTIAGLTVFLVGQISAIAFREWLTFCQADLNELLEGQGAPPS